MMQFKTLNVRISPDKLEEDQALLNSFLSEVNTIKTEVAFRSTPVEAWAVAIFYEIKTRNYISQTPYTDSIKDIPLTEEELLMERYNKIRLWRNNKAAELNLKPFELCSNEDIENIVGAEAKTQENVLKIKGWGAKKLARMGEDFLVFLAEV